MLSSLTKKRARCAVMAACATPFLVGRALGGVDFNEAGSSVKITHYAERDNAGSFGTKNVVPPPTSGSMPIPGSYQYSKTILLNGGSSSASATIGAVTNSQNVGFTFASGTGITQSDPTGTSFSKAAQLKFVINGQWNVTSGGFGPTAYGYLAFTLGGTIPPGDSSSVDIDLSWKDGSNNNLRAPISQTIAFPPSSLPYAFSNSAKLNSGSVTAGNIIKVTGTITFNALDPGATIDLHPTDFEMSAAPPTYKFTDKTNNIADPANWTIDATMAQDFPSPTPNNPGVRAYFGPTNNSATDVTLNAPVTLGMLDINRSGMTIGGNSTLTFDTQANNAVLFVRNINNFSGQVNGQVTTATPSFINAPVVLNKPLEIVVDTEQPAMANGPISGVGGIIKNGLGNLMLNAPNTFTGGITVNSGTITPTVDGALGSNTISLSGGAINVMTPQPFGPGGGTIAVGAHGQINIGTNGITGVNYNIATFGAISGSQQELQGLTIGSNLFLKPNAMIAHQSFDTGPVLGNPAGLTNTPTYVFGIATDFLGGQDLACGLASVSPWSGFGGDTQSHTIGSLTTATNRAITACGTTQFVALGGQLAINEQVKGINNPAIIKNGPGLVSFNSLVNTFIGPTEVQTGPMAINGAWTGPITVDPGASLGGTGNINGSVTFVDDANNPPLFQPGSMGSVASNATSAGNTTITGPGTIKTGSMFFSPHTHLVYDLDDPNAAGGSGNDLLVINGNLTLDGILDINDGLEFTGGVYTLMTYTGNFVDNGVLFGNVDLQDFPQAQIFNVPNSGGPGGSIMIAVPEPGTVGLLIVGAATVFAGRKRAFSLSR